MSVCFMFPLHFLAPLITMTGYCKHSNGFSWRQWITLFGGVFPKAVLNQPGAMPSSTVFQVSVQQQTLRMQYCWVLGLQGSSGPMSKGHVVLGWKLSQEMYLPWCMQGDQGSNSWTHTYMVGDLATEFFLESCYVYFTIILKQ